MYLGGFVYDSIDNPVNVPTRLDWLQLDPDDYHPQPYEQLAAVYRRAGNEQAARRVAIAKQWHRRPMLTLPAKAWNWLLYLTVGYGYRT